MKFGIAIPNAQSTGIFGARLRRTDMKLLAVGLLLLSTSAMPDKVVYHVAVQGSTQIKCKITHKATKTEPYLLINCDYRCDRPVNASWDVKAMRENIYCRSGSNDSPAAQGQPLESDND